MGTLPNSFNCPRNKLRGFFTRTPYILTITIIEGLGAKRVEVILS